MTYYRWNTKYIDHAERTITQPTSKVSIVLAWVMVSLFWAISIYCLVTAQYVGMFVILLISLTPIVGSRDETHKKLLAETREQYLSTITLDDDTITLHDGNGHLEKVVRYTEIYGIQRVVIPATVEYFIPNTVRVKPRVYEQLPFICLYTANCRLAPNVVFEECLNISKVILFPFYQSAWNTLVDKFPKHKILK